MNKEYRQPLNNLEQNLVHTTFLQREEQRYHHTYDEELLQYEYLRDGDIRSIEESKRLFRNGINGKLSSDPLRDKKYLFVASVTLACRFAIEGGMDAQDSYNLSDLYIQQMDVCRSIQEVYELQTAMITEYTQKLASLHKQITADRTYSTKVQPNGYEKKTIALCTDYVYYHLHEKIKIEDIAAAVGLTPNHLSMVFKKETGMTIQEYVRKRRIDAAQNMLLYSDYSLTEIAHFLAFSSASHFISVFHKVTGVTPKEYQNKNFRKHERWKKQHIPPAEILP